ncbi:MAG: cell division protein FtsL [Myxococcales bacterium]|nr:cell division protein FtsL [Myxococcales bacterium]
MKGRSRSRGKGPSFGSVVLELLPAALLCVLFAAVGLLHVTSRVMVVQMGYRLSELEQEGRAISRERDTLELELATLRSPARLERAAKELLGMAPPAPAAVITVRDTEGKAAVPVSLSRGREKERADPSDPAPRFRGRQRERVRVDPRSPPPLPTGERAFTGAGR